MTHPKLLSSLFVTTLTCATLIACGDDGSSAGAAGTSGADAGGAAGAASGGASAGGSAGSGGTAGSGGSATGGTGGTTATTCLEKLDQLGVAYQLTQAKGVVDAVKLTDKLNGVLIASTDTDQVSKDPMGCEFVLHLWEMAEVLKAYDIYKIGTLGAYCYRCCCYWSEENYCRGPNDPEPDCTQAPWSGYSSHSWGRAIDIRWLYKGSGEVYDIDNPAHWVAWSTSSQTCGAALSAQTGISKELYALACELSAKKVFGTILTPNYNDAHRNHFHADIGKSGEPTKWVVLSSQTNVDVGPGDD